MKRILFLLLITSILAGKTRAQDCAGMVFKTGMQFEMSTFNAKDKPTGKISYEVKDVHKEGGSTSMDLTAIYADDKGKQRPPYTVRYTCTGSELVADLSGMMQSMQNGGLKDMELKMKTNKLTYPATFSVGQKLDDGLIEADLVSNGTTMMNLSMTVINRKVEGTQSITTPAGTFDTYRITSDMTTEFRMGIPIRNSMHTISYRAPGQILDVKAETYNKSGKLVGYTLLTKAN